MIDHDFQKSQILKFYHLWTKILINLDVLEVDEPTFKRNLSKSNL